MIEIRKGFQEHNFIKEFKELPISTYEKIEKIHKYDKQRLKSLLKETVDLNNCKIEWTKESQSE